MAISVRQFLLKNTSVRQTIAKNVFWLAVSQVGSRATRMAVVIFAARILGASEYGLFSYALGVVGVFAVFADMGINEMLVRETARKNARDDSYFGTIFGIKLALVFATAAAIFLITPFVIKFKEVADIMPFAIGAFLFDVLRDFFSAFFRGGEKMELEALATAATNVTIAALGFVVLYLAPSYKFFIIAYTLGSFVGFLVATVCIGAKKNLIKALSTFKKELVLPILRSSWPVVISAVMVSFMFNVDIVMIGWWRSAEEVGWYSAAQKVIGALGIGAVLIAMATFPALSRLISNKDEDKLTHVVEYTISLLFLIALPITVGGIILAKPIMSFLFGSGYIPAEKIFSILILLVPISYLLPVLNGFVFACDRQARLIKFIVVASFSNIMLNILITPGLGGQGAAIATVAANFINAIFLWRLVKKLHNFQILPHLKKILLASVLMGAAAFIVQKTGAHILANISISIIVYFAALLFMRERVFLEVKKIIYAQ